MNEGVETKGYLFNLLPPKASQPLKLSKRNRESLNHLYQDPTATRIRRGRRLSTFAEKVIEIVINKLEKRYGDDCRLADYLLKYLELDRHPLPKAELAPSTPYVIDMISALVTAILDERDIRLGVIEEPGEEDFTLNSESDNNSDVGSEDEAEDATSSEDLGSSDEEENQALQPSAIFIPPVQRGRWVSENLKDRDGNEAGGPWVFTSWDNGWRGGGMERLASIEVGVFENDATESSGNDEVGNDKRTPLLRNFGWVNGIWYVRGAKMGTFVFPLPGINDTGPE